MGKKPFINKKKSATFTLVYRDSLQDDGGDEVGGGDKVFTRIDGGTNHVPGFSGDDPWSQIPVDERSGPSLRPGRRAPRDPHRRGPDDDDEEWEDWEGEEGDLEQLDDNDLFSLTGGGGALFGEAAPGDRPRIGVTEETRKEMVSLGFADDGYNYMQHLRQIGGRVGSAFIPAPRPRLSLRPDVQAFDARKASVVAASSARTQEGGVEDGGGAADVPLLLEEVFRGVKPIRQKGSHLRGIDPDIAKALEESEGSACEDEDDLLEDDFVTLANDEAGPSGEGGGAAGSDGRWTGDVVNGDDDSRELHVRRVGGGVGGLSEVGTGAWGEEEEEGEDHHQRVGSGKKGGEEEEDWTTGHVAGSEELETARSWRKGTASSVGTREISRPVRLLDEQFENLALAEYGDEEEWGELDENDPEAQGCRGIEDFSDILDQFLEEHKPHMNPHAYVTPAEEKAGGHSLATLSTKPSETAYREDTRKPVKEGGLGEAQGEVEEHAEAKANDDDDDDFDEAEERREEAVLVEVVQGRDEWDCETVVSTYSNLENHPARIGAPSRRRSQQMGSALLEDAGRPTTSGIIRLGGRQKLPVDYLPPRAATALSGKASSATAVASASSGMVPETGVGGNDVKSTKKGPRGGETPAERKARKGALKAERREARACKKAMKTLYQAEVKLAQQVVAQTSVQGIHLP